MIIVSTDIFVQISHHFAKNLPCWLAYAAKVAGQLGFLPARLVKSGDAKGICFAARAFIVGAGRGIPAVK